MIGPSYAVGKLTITLLINKRATLDISHMLATIKDRMLYTARVTSITYNIKLQGALQPIFRIIIGTLPLYYDRQPLTKVYVWVIMSVHTLFVTLYCKERQCYFIFILISQILVAPVTLITGSHSFLRRDNHAIEVLLRES